MVVNASELYANTAGSGGGIFVAGAGDDPTSLTLNDTSVTNNTATSESSNRGGGVFNWGAPVTLANGSTVTGNTPDNCAGTAIAGCTN